MSFVSLQPDTEGQPAVSNTGSGPPFHIHGSSRNPVAAMIGGGVSSLHRTSR